jgi:hypothetical protein
MTDATPARLRSVSALKKTLNSTALALANRFDSGAGAP